MRKNQQASSPDRPDLQFNLSHSHGAAVCALHHLPIGVDVERLRPAPRRLSRGMDDGDFFLAGGQIYVNYIGYAGRDCRRQQGMGHGSGVVAA